MKPYRLTLTNVLVMGYGLDTSTSYLQALCIMTTTTPLLITVHNTYNKVKEQRLNPSYCRVTPQSDEMRHLIDAFNCVEGCPIFAEVYDCCRIYADASLAGARKPRSGACDTAINWSVDLHHAKRGEASGFCYVNSIVLAILELLRLVLNHFRVPSMDLVDIHHGDDVELSFYHSNRMVTVSKLDDNGASLGTHFCSNVPLRDGIDDEMYVTVFKTVIEDMVTAYRPTAVVLQCGADSLGRDRLGAFNLSIVAHGECVNFVPKFNVPLLVQGEIPDEPPATWKLHPPLTARVGNQNSPASLQKNSISI
ncbi:hypothetical protein EDD16DRAFT_1736600 [Pisolithus croceorrhizus]|nr:hypothetical protein EDD16DRAFT_1736600 [Pisolithus croceorrhizus]